MAGLKKEKWKCVCYVSSRLCYLSESTSINRDSKLTIVLFARRHFSGSLFNSITLLLFTRKTTKGNRIRDLQPLTLSLRFSPKSVIHLERREEREHCLCNAQTGIPLSLLTPVPRQMGVGDKTHKRLRLKARHKRVAPLCSTRGTVQIFQDSASFGNFGDSAVAPIYSQNY